MRAATFLVGLVQWRWTPSVALVAGSLAFVGFAVLLVPEDLGGVASGADRLSRAARQGVAKKVDVPAGDSPEPSADDAQPRAMSPHRPAGLSPNLHAAPATNNIVQSIFHPTPKAELPVEPVDPNPPPPPEPPPLPAPTQTVFTLENSEPPPVEPQTPQPAPPEAPQGITDQ
jgi:hypothetical protein